MAKSKIVNANKKIAEGVVSSYKKIEEGVVGGYKKIEDGVVSGFEKMTSRIQRSSKTASPREHCKNECSFRYG